MKQISHCKSLCLLTLAVLIAGAFLASPVLALKVEGARIALDVEPGKTYTSPIGISLNPEETEGTFSIDVMGFGQSTDGSYTALAAASDTSPYSARTFITIDKPTVTLKPGERADVTATIAIPAGTSGGGRYAIILVHPAESSSGAPAAFATAVAIPVFLTLKDGTITESAEITALEPSVTEAEKSFDIVMIFKNTGNCHYYGVVGSVAITDTNGNVAKTVKTDPFIRAIVPGRSVSFSNRIEGGLPQGTYQVTVQVESQDGETLGRKEAILQVGNSEPVRVTQIPTAPGFGALAAILGLAAILYGSFRFRKGGKG
ncbi:MAG: hypothetical protein PHH09_06265 [Methanoregulaceae archaeon]|nr:hypothetical protein [Methanoregulaceae archaeon]